MFKKFKITTILGLQTFQLLRFVSFLVISIVFTRSTLSLKDIGDFELIMFFAGAVTYFWVMAIIQSLLPLFNNSDTYIVKKDATKHKSPEIFNTFLIISIITLLLCISGYFLQGVIQVYRGGEAIPYPKTLLLFIFLTTPATLIEYIYLLYRKPGYILTYGFVIFVLQALFVIVPVILGYGLYAGLRGLLIISALRYIWLLIVVYKYSKIRVSIKYIKEHIYLAVPLIISTLLSGSSQYIDGIIVSSHFSPDAFAVFRYGAKEMPLVINFASGLSNAMLTQFTSIDKIKFSLLTLKNKSLRLMHILFPISMVLLLYSNNIFSSLFDSRFNRSSDVFMVYILLIVSRLLFPQTILIGLKKTKVVMFVSIIVIVFNIALTLVLIPNYGLVGVALATTIMFWIEKVILIAYNYYKLGIKPNDYIPLGYYFAYSGALLLLFVLIDHRVIMIPK